MSDDNMCYILKEYLNYHEKYTEIYGKKTVVLMMVGQFYELYAVINEDIHVGPDLNELSDILNVQFVRRNKKIKEISFNNFLMMGWPDHALLKFRNILLNNNYTIIKVDQITSPPNPERGVTEIISPSTIIDSYNNSDTNYLVSLFIDLFHTPQKEKIYTAGLSAIDISTGKNHVHKIKSSVEDKKIWNDEIYRLIQYYNPSEIIIHYHNEEFNYTKDILSRKWSINESNIHINLTTSKQYLKLSYQNEFLKKYFSQCGFLTPIEYLGFEWENEIILSYIYMLQFIHEHKIENTMSLHNPEFKLNSQYLLLSHNCIEQLNVINKDTTEKYGSLVSILNKCFTAIGRRLCKERILYPILDTEQLNHRYDMIDLFQTKTNNEYIYNLCNPNLKKIIDIEKIHRKIGLTIISPYELYSLHNSYCYILKITETITSFEFMNSFISDYSDMINDMKIFMNHYESIFKLDELEKWSLQNMETSVFQEGIYPQLDILDNNINHDKKLLLEIATKLSFYIDKKKEEVIKIGYSDKYGYHLYMTQNRSRTLTKNLNNLLNKKITFKNENQTFLIADIGEIQTIQRGANYHLSMNYIETLSNSILLKQKKLQGLNRDYYLREIRTIYNNNNELMKNIVSFIGLVDLYSNIAKISIENVFKRPHINKKENSFISAKDIRHPIVEKIQTDLPYVPNDIELNENGILLYGTNACGKSTLMKSIGLTLIMAQSGFFVPCSSFQYSPYTSIFTRILNNDNIFRGQSSFAVEMSELRGILLRADKKSLVLGDELCSGTENVSALSIVTAGLKRLSDLKCSFIFTSHLHQLMDTSFVRNISNLNVYHLKIIYDQEKDILIYDRKLVKGSGPPIYGLEVCKAMGLDKEFISLARSVQLEITGSDKNFLADKQSNYNSDIVMDKCQVCFEKAEHSHHIKEQNVADENNIIEHFHKNTKHNLVPLCEKCHNKVHNENLRIFGYIQSNQGIRLDYKFIEQKEVLENKKKKYSKKDIETILKYKSDVETKVFSKTRCLRKLELEDHISISIGTFNKILKGGY